MPIIRKEGKDTIIFVTREDHAIPSQITLPEPEPHPGLFLPNGEINWSCPCLGGMATGPCGLEFREAFTCFQKSSNDPKGSDCYEIFKTMQQCMSEYPSLYDNKVTDMDLEELENDETENNHDQDRKALKNIDPEFSDTNSQNTINTVTTVAAAVAAKAVTTGTTSVTAIATPLPPHRHHRHDHHYHHYHHHHHYYYHHYTVLGCRTTV
ncbi:PREDICTED: mitochondrial intermembrane space import and assembly protein 40 [Ceratosolen solmsi marchali]|uniref:Mitochondrial intermembrane space import and assembly protein 40 n=1 Tax=Ceratosolen solmsi marchali TaxID=326594 RepID=A0AAJ6YUN0_9HYME|nr:PREDICTED: mitochondrial intermembrane space import and assembly protein 40 [Ceratosolen solmsi marchali]